MEFTVEGELGGRKRERTVSIRVTVGWREGGKKREGRRGGYGVQAGEEEKVSGKGGGKAGSCVLGVQLGRKGKSEGKQAGDERGNGRREGGMGGCGKWCSICCETGGLGKEDGGDIRRGTTGNKKKMEGNGKWMKGVEGKRKGKGGKGEGNGMREGARVR